MLFLLCVIKSRKSNNTTEVFCFVTTTEKAERERQRESEGERGSRAPGTEASQLERRTMALHFRFRNECQRQMA